MVRRAEALLQALDLEYRVLDLCTGDLGNAAARTFDIEVYAPGCDMWLEVSSVSWCTDYQARRANIRYRAAGGGQPALRPHAQRLGPRLGPGLGRPGGDRSPGRRVGGASRRARWLPRGAHRHRGARAIVPRSPPAPTGPARWVSGGSPPRRARVWPLRRRSSTRLRSSTNKVARSRLNPLRTTTRSTATSSRAGGIV